MLVLVQFWTQKTESLSDSGRAELLLSQTGSDLDRNMQPEPDSEWSAGYQPEINAGDIRLGRDVEITLTDGYFARSSETPYGKHMHSTMRALTEQKAVGCVANSFVEGHSRVSAKSLWNKSWS